MVINRRILFASIAGMLCALTCARGETEGEADFNWSWEGGGKAEAPPAPVTEILAAPEEEGFNWSFGDPDGKGAPSAGEKVSRPADNTAEKSVVLPADRAVDVPARPVGGGKKEDRDAYAELLRENLALRRQVATAVRDGEEARAESGRLTRNVQDLEQRITQMVSLIQGLNAQKDSASGDRSRVEELEEQLKSAGAEQARLNEDLSALRKRLVELKEQGEMPAPRAALPTVAPGSDLFGEVQRENDLLKQKLVDIETARLQAQKSEEELARRNQKAEEEAREARARQKELQKKLDEIGSAEKKSRQAVDALLKKIPDLEQNLEQLNTTVSRKDEMLSARERELETLKIELQRRENRLARAEKMASLLDQARQEVQQVNNREKRDMHYNMAAIYAREGRHREAEKEYLRALQVDPSDADVHYNLGILYEEELKDSRRALVHYRRYLKLRPSAPDVDTVRGWIMRLEMDK